MKRLIWWLIAGSRGGINRARIIMLLREKPRNAHQISKALELDYKTVRHHLKILEKNQIITLYGNKKYATLYFLSPILEREYDTYKEIWVQFGKIQLSDNGDIGDDSE